MSAAPRKASEEVRKSILDALRDPKRRFFDMNSPSRSWLDKWGLKSEGFFLDLIESLDPSDNIFLKPKNNPADIQCYQCILDYPSVDEEYPAVDVHITIRPKGEPPTVRIAVHPSDTVRTLPPLPLRK